MTITDDPDTKNKERHCKNCSALFVAKTYNAIFCKQEVLLQCVVCDENFTTVCKANRKSTCDMSCSRKLTRQRQGEKNIRNCDRCDTEYQAQSHNAIYCGERKTTACEHCSQSIDNICNATFLRFCSDSCKNVSNRQHRYVIKEQRDCILCGDSFTPVTSGNTRCPKDHTKHCGTCGGEYLPRTVLAYHRNPGYCDNICATLGQYGTSIPSDKLVEFKNIDKWAIQFEDKYGRKPDKYDVKVYFGVFSLPSRADRSLFYQGRGSFLETIVEHYIQEQYPELEFKKIKKKLPVGWREIDIYLPELKMGFEVQDFSSHHMTKNNVPSKYNIPKNGPRYHAEKRQLFQSVGITVHELWENSIRDGSFRKDVDKAIEAARRQLDPHSMLL